MRFVIPFFVFLIPGCINNTQPLPGTTNSNGDHSISVFLQPFENIAADDLLFLKKNIEKWYKVKVNILDKTMLPANAFYTPRGRYMADSLLIFLNAKRKSKTSYFIGITQKDISTQKDTHINWGIMGLGYQPGNACVISYYRLRKGNQSGQMLQQRLLKVALHELGHNFGLPHCPDQNCFLVDAEGKDKLESEVGFCAECHQYLVKKGFQ